MTTTRMIVVLRSELGNQLSIAQKELAPLCESYKELQDEGANYKHTQMKSLVKRIAAGNLKVTRLEKAALALGALQLGDIEDKEF